MRTIISMLMLAGLTAPLHAHPGPHTPGQAAAQAAAQPPPREKFADAERAFRDARATLIKEYVDDTVSEDDLYRGAVAGMLTAGGSKWDALLSPTELNDLHSDLTGEVVGIGVEIGIDQANGFIVVIDTFPGSPAGKAGLAAGDRILKVDGKSVRGADGMEIARGIRGKAGTSVSLSLLHEDRIVTVNLKRAAIPIAAASDLMLPDSVALVWVRAFNEKTPELLRASLTRVAAAHPRGVVLDLRHNQGGLLDKMIECAGQLLPKGSTIATEVLRGKREEVLRTTGEPLLKGVPLTVLVDGWTASGAELLAGALRDNLGARLVGSRTHGKWNVQKISDLPNGYAIKYTIGVFKTPKGLQPDGKGLDPEVPVDLDEKTVEHMQRVKESATRVAGDAQLRAALALLK